MDVIKQRKALANQVQATTGVNICRLYAVFPKNENGKPEVIVSVLLNPTTKTAFLWRIGISKNILGLVAAMYANATDSIREEFGKDWSINFGGSPRLSLSTFKDYLGATPTIHYCITKQKSGYPWFIWNVGFSVKDWIIRQRDILTQRRKAKH